MFPEVMANMITKDDMTMWDQFCAPYIEDIDGCVLVGSHTA